MPGARGRCYSGGGSGGCGGVLGKARGSRWRRGGLGESPTPPPCSMGRWARVASESEAGPDGGHSGAGEGRAGRCGR